MISVFTTAHGIKIITVDGESVARFEELVARACNVWDFAPAEIKRFHDELIHGHALQNYEVLSSGHHMRGREELSPEENMALDTYTKPSTDTVKKPKTDSE